ncbi:MAG: hypothetical protein ACLQVF_07865 [Isosphaeraceae bacterium]
MGASRNRERPRRRQAPSAAAYLRLVVCVFLASLAGCNGFSVRGPRDRSEDRGFFGWHFYAPFDTSEVKTVFVYFKSQTFRRDIQTQLTEAVCKEISLRTPYRVVGDKSKADSILSGIVSYADKNLVVEAPTNLPRELNGTINVAVNWTRNPPTDIEKLRPPTIVAETINFVPEVGETSLSGFNHVIQSIAKQVVDMMEQAWYTERDLE